MVAGPLGLEPERVQVPRPSRCGMDGIPSKEQPVKMLGWGKVLSFFEATKNPAEAESCFGDGMIEKK